MRASSRVLTKVSTIAKVVFTARVLLRIVANIYNPRSVKAVGFTVLNFNCLRRSKFSTRSSFSYLSSSNRKTQRNDYKSILGEKDNREKANSFFPRSLRDAPR